jgi:hypothetical protein
MIDQVLDKSQIAFEETLTKTTLADVIKEIKRSA